MNTKLSTNYGFARYSSPYALDWCMNTYKYVPFTNLMSPDQVYKYRSGSCHDMVMFELDELHREGYDAYGRFLIAVDQDGQGGETHSFVYFHIPNDRDSFWFEQAWTDYAGIHAFSTDAELFGAVVEEFKKRNPSMNVYIGDFIPEEHQVGEDLQTLVDICMDSAVRA